MSGRPRVSVVLPVYNGERHLGAAIESLLAQTFRDFELIVVDDGSEDGSAALAASFGDPRIRVERTPHGGMVAACNRAFDLARGEYLVRMDHDDVCLRERLASQVRFMDGSPRVGISGTWVRALLPDGSSSRWTFPRRSDRIRCGLLFEPTLAHPSVIMRRWVVERHGLRYDARYPRVEDWDLWRRAAERLELANLPRELVRYRVHPDRVSARHRTEQERAGHRIQTELLDRLGVAGHPLRHVHADVSMGSLDCSRRSEGFVRAVAAWFDVLRRANSRRGVYPARALDEVLGERILRVLDLNPHLGGARLRILAETGWLPRCPLPRTARFALKTGLHAWTGGASESSP